MASGDYSTSNDSKNTTQSYSDNGRPIESRMVERRHFLNDLEQSLRPVSRSRHCLTLNISETVRDTDIVAMKY